MKIVQVGDIHIPDKRIAEFDEMLSDLGARIDATNPDVVVITGDLFVHRNKLTNDQVRQARKFIKETLGKYEKIVISGNHDVSMSADKSDAILSIFEHDKDVVIGKEIGSYYDLDNVRFHFFPYPTKSTLVEMGFEHHNELSTAPIFDKFTIDSSKQNVLVYHGSISSFRMNTQKVGSEELLNVGTEIYINMEELSRFDVVMAGHLHKYQTNTSHGCTIVYAGCPFPLTFEDDEDNGFILWNIGDSAIPEFKKVEHKYPYLTVDLGAIYQFKTGIMEEIDKKLRNNADYSDCRVRVKYHIYPVQAQAIDTSRIAAHFKNSIEVKPVVIYKEHSSAKQEISFEGFKDNSIIGVITEYIDEHKYDPAVHEIAKEVENRAKKTLDDDERGVHFSPLKLRVTNFKAFEEVPEVDFTKLDTIVGVFGPSWSGKSSLIEAIIWALFAKTPRNKDSKSVIRNGENSTTVELEFLAFNNTYKIARTHQLTGTNSLDLYQWIGDTWIPINGESATETKQRISNLVGSYDLFTATVYSPQQKIDLLIEQTPSNRKQTILDCLQVDVLEKRRNIIKEIKKEADDAYSYEQGKQSFIVDQIEKLNTVNYDAAIEAAKDNIVQAKKEQAVFTERIGTLEKQYSMLIEYKDEYEKVDPKITAVRDKIKELRTKLFATQQKRNHMAEIMTNKDIVREGLDRLRQAKEKEEDLVAERARNTERQARQKRYEKELSSVESSYNEQIRLLQESRTSLMSQLGSLKTLNCSKEDCPLNERVNDQKTKIRLEVDGIDEQIRVKETQKQTEASNIKEKILRVKAELDNSYFDQKVYMDVLQAHMKERNEKWEEWDYRLQAGEDLTKEYDDFILTYNEQIGSLIEHRDSMVSRRTELAKLIGSYTSAENEIQKARIDLKSCNEQIEAYNKNISNYEHKKSELAELGRLLEEKVKDVKKAEEYARHCKSYQEIMSKSGVIYALISTAIPMIESFAKNLLEEATSNTLTIDIENSRDLASGKAKDEVMIYMINERGRRDVSEGSGAEKVLISLALRAAMANLLSSRSGSKVELFIIDEGMGAFDSESLPMGKAIFNELGKIFNKILFITHVDEMKDIAQSTISVIPKGNVSTFVIQGGK